ncbi:hypothetical protein E2I00_001892, partial [Balaenoptera physalus]
RSGDAKDQDQRKDVPVGRWDACWELAGQPPIAIFQLIQGGRPFPLALLGWAPSSITFMPLFGQRFDYRDPVFVSLLGLIDEVRVLLGTPSLQANVVACALDMAMAGMETTSATLQWAALLMGKHPSVQGGAGPSAGAQAAPPLEDQRSLPYTNAVLHEVQHFITLLPHVPRCTASDTQLGGYLLPKNPTVLRGRRPPHRANPWWGRAHWGQGSRLGRPTSRGPYVSASFPPRGGGTSGTLWLVTASLQDRRDTLNTSLPKVDANLLGAQKQLSPHIPQARPTGNTCFSAINATATGC